MSLLEMFEEFAPLADELQSLITTMSTGGADAGDASIRFDEIKKNEPATLPAFCLLLERNFLPKITLIQVKNYITAQWDILPEEMKPPVMEFLLHLSKTITDKSTAVILISALCCIFKNVNGEWDGFLEFVLAEFSENVSSFINFVVELYATTQKNNTAGIKVTEFIMTNAEQITAITLAGLQDADWETRIKSMSLVLPLYMNAEDPSVLGPHIEIILSYLDASLSLNENDFSKLWTSFGEIAEIVDFEQEQRIQIAQSAYKAASEYTGSAIELERPLFAVKPFFGAIGPELIAQILELLFNIAGKLFTDEKALPNEVLSLYGFAVDYYDNEEYYNFLKEKMEISDFSDEEQLTTFIVAFSILNEVFTPLIDQFRRDIDFYISLFSECAATENELLLCCVCQMLNDFDNKFEKPVIDNGLFLDILVPLMSSENKELRSLSINAAFNMMDIIHNPIPGIFQKIYSVIEEIDPSVLSMYMRLLAKSLEVEKKIDQETLASLISLTTEWLSNEDMSIVCGGISMSIVLISLDETTHEALVPAIVAAIQEAIASEQEDPVKCAFEAFDFLINALKADILPLIEGLVEVTVEKATACDDQTIRCNAAKTLVNLAIVSEDAGLAEKVTTVIMSGFNGDSRAYNDIVLNNLPEACNIMPFEALQKAFESICLVSKSLKSLNYSKDSLLCLQLVLSKYKGENISVLESLAAKLVIEYANNQWASQAGLASPEDSSKLIGDICYLMYDFFHAPFDGMDEIFEYVSTLMESEDEEVIDSVSPVIGSAAENGVIPEALHEKIVQFSASLLASETDESLYQNSAFMFACLLSGSILPPDFFVERLEILTQWNAAAEEEGDVDAKTSISYLFMVLVIDFNVPVHPIFIQALNEFPPNEGSDIIKMAEAINRALQNPQLCASVKDPMIGAVMKALSIPTVILTRCQIPTELLQTVAQSALAVFGQDAITAEIGKQDQVSAARISQFYQ